MNHPVGIGLIGCGTWGAVHARTYAASPHVRLVSVCDRDPGKAAAFARDYGASALTDSDSLLADPDIQAVAIATPDFTHTDLVLSALDAGKHVLVEKPLASTAAECRRILEKRDASGLKLMVDFHNRWNLPFLHVRRMVDTGEIGDLMLINMRLNDTLFVPTQLLSWAARSSPAHFLGSHLVDLVRWLSGAEVRRVYSVSRSTVLKGMGIDTPDFYQSIIELTNGCTAVLENCWILSENAPSVFEFKAEFVGTEGTTYVNASDFRMIEAYTSKGVSLPDVTGAADLYGKPTGFCVASIEHFIDCLVRDEQPMVTAEDGLKATLVIEAMARSAETGLPVDLES